MIPFAVTDLDSAFATITDHWSPRVIAQVNDQYVKVAKLLGSLAWHDHAAEDELFYVVRGTLRMEYEERPPVILPAGSIHVVPRATRHNPVADEECWIVLIEPVGTLHTGDVETARTRSIAEQLA